MFQKSLPLPSTANNGETRSSNTRSRLSGPSQPSKSLPAISSKLCVLSGSIKMKPLAGSAAASRRCWTMPPVPVTLATSTGLLGQATRRSLPRLPPEKRPKSHPSLPHQEIGAFMAVLRQREGAAARFSRS